MSVAAYKKTIKETESPRNIEKRVFSKITSNLEKLSDEPDDILKDETKSALWENQRLWMALRADLVLPENSLPPQLRAQLLSLGIWVDNHTQKVLQGKAKIADLVEVNKNIISGLEGKS
jgi:flagellar protein FlaF